MKNGLLAFVFMLFLCGTKLSAQQVVPKDLNQIVSKLHDYMAGLPQEKIHVHFDKPYYSVGDTVWFKVYLVNALNNRLSAISKVVHIDIQKLDGKTEHLVLPVSAGMASAQLVLADSLYRAGDYPLRAYTWWMRNAGEDYFFYHTLRVGSVRAAQPPGAATASKLALDFFPEGGSLVDGVRSRVAFKAIGEHGLGVAVKGHIENGQGEQVTVFQSGRFGMGVFAMLPQAAGTYTAVVTEGMYQRQRFVLPKALADGFVLSVNRNGADSLMIRISRPMGTGSQTELRLVVQSGGEVRHALKLPMHTASISFALERDKLAGGINQLTLFSADNRPLAERLVFVQHQQPQVTLESDKPGYAARELVKVRFDNARNIVGGYSVAVVKDDRAALAGEGPLGIHANLLLRSDLKGNIEDPNYYFTDPDEQKAAELDVLMLSQGWRRFSWTEVLSKKAAPPEYKAEEGLGVSGRIVTLKGEKPVPGASIKLLATREMVFLDTVADALGRFSFDNLQLGDSAEIVLRAGGAKESNKVKIILDQADEMIPFAIREQKAPQNPAADTVTRTSGSQATDLADGKIVQGTTLKTVEIKTRRKAPEIKGSVYPFAAAPPDYTFEPDQLQEMVNLETYLKGLNGVIVKGTEIWGLRKGIEGKMAILLNGSPIKDLSGINPRALTGVQILKPSVVSESMAQGLMLVDNPLLEEGGPAFGIVFLTMKGIPDKFIKPNRPPGFMQTTFRGYTYSREFYVPDYGSQKGGTANDFRSTLFWKPDIITGKDGKADFSFFTPDETGKYRITLEGIDINGQLYQKVSYFEVKAINQLYMHP